MTTSPAPNVAQVALLRANDASLRTEKPTDTPVAGAAGTARTANVAVSHGCSVIGRVTWSHRCIAPPSNVCAEAAGQPALCSTSNRTPLLGEPATVTTMGPLVAVAGTGTRIAVSLQYVGEAPRPLNVTVLPLCAPNPMPVMVTGVPATAAVGPILVMTGVLTTTMKSCVRALSAFARR